ncbi:MAG: SpoVA/SpoVAEb family sporulation membrane protein [Clostridia bacterium]|nr:SpoVA/SpoVAEb family sporulation membrane protein [Clostridia bacterium]
MNYLWAFAVGGLICCVGQVLIDKTKLTPAKILVLFVVLGVALHASGVYEHLLAFAGEGAAVPLTGFGSVIAGGTAQAVDERGLLGALTGPMTAGAAGITAALMCGLIVSVITKPKDK